MFPSVQNGIDCRILPAPRRQVTWSAAFFFFRATKLVYAEGGRQRHPRLARISVLLYPMLVRALSFYLYTSKSVKHRAIGQCW